MRFLGFEVVVGSSGLARYFMPNKQGQAGTGLNRTGAVGDSIEVAVPHGC